MLPPGGVHLLASLPLSINSHMWQRTVCTAFSDCSSWPNKKKTKDKINSQPLTSLIIPDLFLHQIPNQWNLTFVDDISTTGSKLDDIYSLLPFQNMNIYHSYAIILWLGGLLMLRGTCEKNANVTFFVQAEIRATEGHRSAKDEKTSSNCQEKKTKYHPLDIWIYYMRTKELS